MQFLIAAKEKLEIVNVRRSRSEFYSPPPESRKARRANSIRAISRIHRIEISPSNEGEISIGYRAWDSNPGRGSGKRKFPRGGSSERSERRNRKVLGSEQM